MTIYDFTTQPNRLSQHTVKWQAAEADPELLPMWVADMDFLPQPDIKAAIQAYANEHIFGYSAVPDSLYQSIVNWEESQHGYQVDKDAILLIEGVVPAISVAIQAFTQEEDAVLIHTPVYPPFARSVKLNHRKLVTNSLIEQNGHFEIDFDQLERDLVDHQVKLYLLCSPHNPGGRVWSADELKKIGQICQKHHVILVSDEIHQDLTLFGHRHVTVNTVSDQFKEFTIVLSSATKTFNIAGTKNSFAIIENPDLRRQFARRQLANNQHEVPTIGLIATEAAYTYGVEWLAELKAVLEDNVNLAVQLLTEQTKIRVMKPEGTYLIWLDFSDYGLTNDEIQYKLREEANVQLNDGVTFGTEGDKHARLNVAAPRAIVQEACQRIVRVFSK